MEAVLEQTLGLPPNPKVLIVGSGAREHTIAWKLHQSSHRPQVFAAPGNPGMAELCKCVPISVDAVDDLVHYAKEEGIHLVVVGPELPLSRGLVDACESAGIPAFGPARAAAELESSKAFAKEIMEAAEVPTAAFRVFDSADDAKQYVRQIGAPIVIKADGLAAGKGVVVAMSLDEAEAAVDEMLTENRFGSAGSRIVVEQFLQGKEASLMCFIDGDTAVPMIAARDYKRAFDGDEGPNTGGMGAFAPIPDFTSEITNTVLTQIVRPTLNALKQRSITYRGVLYVGLMLTQDGPYVIEFNARFGDPETQVVLPLLRTDLLEVLWATAKGVLHEVRVEWHSGAAVCVVLASEGYPAAPVLGDEINVRAAHLSDAVGAGMTTTGIPNGARAIFHAGTGLNDEGKLVTSGGRVITVTATGGTIDSAREGAYELADSIPFRGKHCRKDIALFL